MWRAVLGSLVLVACGGPAPSVCDHPPTALDALVCSTGREIRVGGAMLDWSAGKPEPAHASTCGYECQGSPWVSYWRYNDDPHGPTPMKLCACRSGNKPEYVIELAVSLDVNDCRLSAEEWQAFSTYCPK